MSTSDDFRQSYIPFNVFFCYREHILYQKCAFPAIVQFNDMENITRLSCFFLLLHNSSVFVNTAGQWYHPVYSNTCILKAVLMWSVSRLISFKIRVWHIFKKFIFDNPVFFIYLSSLWKKSLALRRRTILSTQPLIYRILVSGKLSTRPFIYHISVSGKLSLCFHNISSIVKSQVLCLLFLCFCVYYNHLCDICQSFCFHLF